MTIITKKRYRYNIGDFVDYNGEEYLVVGIYYPYRAYNFTSTARHFILKPLKRVQKPSYKTSYLSIQQNHMVSCDPTEFSSETISHFYISRNPVVSVPITSNVIHLIGTQYDPSQQPWDEGDI